MTVTTATALVILIENTLGWTPEPTPTRPLWKLRQAEAAKINRRVKTNPTLYTWENLELAVAYLRILQRPVETPCGIFVHVESALKLAALKQNSATTTLEDLVSDAMREETWGKRPGYDTWVSRLTRASGPYRQEVYDEWVRERRQT